MYMYSCRYPAGGGCDPVHLTYTRRRAARTTHATRASAPAGRDATHPNVLHRVNCHHAQRVATAARTPVATLRSRQGGFALRSGPRQLGRRHSHRMQKLVQRIDRVIPLQLVPLPRLRVLRGPATATSPCTVGTVSFTSTSLGAGSIATTFTSSAAISNATTPAYSVPTTTAVATPASAAQIAACLPFYARHHGR